MQKQEGQNKRGGQEDDDENQGEEGNYDAYGNRIDDDAADKKPNEDSDDKSDAAKIKDNLRNSSKIYYNITHSIKEDIKV